MKLTQKLKIPLLASGIALATALSGIGCSTTQGTNPLNTLESKKHSELEKASIILNTPKEKVFSLPGNYFIREEDYYKLTPYAGILRNELKIEKTPEGYILEGDYASAIDSKELKELVKIADKNNDKIITPGEANNIGKRLYDKVAK